MTSGWTFRSTGWTGFEWAAKSFFFFFYISPERSSGWNSRTMKAVDGLREQFTACSFVIITRDIYWQFIKRDCYCAYDFPFLSCKFVSLADLVCTRSAWIMADRLVGRGTWEIKTWLKSRVPFRLAADLRISRLNDVQFAQLRWWKYNFAQKGCRPVKWLGSYRIFHIFFICFYFHPLIVDPVNGSLFFFSSRQVSSLAKFHSRNFCTPQVRSAQYRRFA